MLLIGAAAAPAFIGGFAPEFDPGFAAVADAAIGAATGAAAGTAAVGGAPPAAESGRGAAPTADICVHCKRKFERFFDGAASEQVRLVRASDLGGRA